MNSYLANLLPRLQQFSATLDRKEILIDQPWVNVDSDFNKVHYIFRRDGSLIVSLNGNAVVGKWQYIPTASSLLLEFSNKTYLLNQGFIDKGILVLKKDGFLDTAWMLINENIIKDLDAERYLNGLLKQKLHITSATMADGTVLEFEDPRSLGLTEGSEVSINGIKGANGIYKHKSENIHYKVWQGKVNDVFRLYAVPTNKGILEIRKSVFDDKWSDNDVLLNSIPAPDDKYIVGKNEHYLKHIITQNGKITEAAFKMNIVSNILLIIAILLLCIAVIGYIITQKEQGRAQATPSVTPVAETNLPRSYYTSPLHYTSPYQA